MSRLQFIAKPAAEIALVAATPRTVIQLATPANHRVVIYKVAFFFDGVSVTGEPIIVTLALQTTAGTMSALTLVKTDQSLGETIQTAATHTATAEPTTTSHLDGWECHPQQGWAELYPMGQEIILAGGTRVGLICTAPANVNVMPKIFCEE